MGVSEQKVSEGGLELTRCILSLVALKCPVDFDGVSHPAQAKVMNSSEKLPADRVLCEFKRHTRCAYAADKIQDQLNVANQTEPYAANFQVHNG